MNKEQAFGFVKQILRSPVFLARSIDQQQIILDQIIETGEITPQELFVLINEALQQQTANQQLSKNLESLPYDTFLNIIRQGDIKGTDLLYLCNTSTKLREYCNRSFQVKNKQGDVIQTIPNYLFTSLLADKGIQLLPGQDAKEIYKQKVVGGYVYGFGSNWHSQLGLQNNKENRLIPTLNPTLNNIVQISAGIDYALCLDNEGYIWGFGSNSHGQLGLGDITNRTIPTVIQNFSGIVKVCAGYNHSLCIDKQGHVWAFGDNQYGQLGFGNNAASRTVIPTMLPNLNNIVDITIGNYHSLCLDNQGRVWGFGSNDDGELGLGDNDDRLVPTLIPNLANIIKVKAGERSSFCLDDQGHVWSFGDNATGQLGLGDKLNRNIPTLIPALNNIVEIGTSTYHSLCLDNQGHVWSFGQGELGFEYMLSTFVPVMIANLNNIVQISVGNFQSLCLDHQGRVWGFGKNKNGALGLGDIQDRNIPTLIPDLDGVFQISTGSNYSLILKF